MDLAELRAAHPGWVIDHAGADLMCRHGAFRFRAMDPDDAHDGIVTRETAWAVPPARGMTVEELGAELADPGF